MSEQQLKEAMAYFASKESDNSFNGSGNYYGDILFERVKELEQELKMSKDREVRLTKEYESLKEDIKDR